MQCAFPGDGLCHTLSVNSNALPNRNETSPGFFFPPSLESKRSDRRTREYILSDVLGHVLLVLRVEFKITTFSGYFRHTYSTSRPCSPRLAPTNKVCGRGTWPKPCYARFQIALTPARPLARLKRPTRARSSSPSTRLVHRHTHLRAQRSIGTAGRMRLRVTKTSLG